MDRVEVGYRQVQKEEQTRGKEHAHWLAYKVGRLIAASSRGGVSLNGLTYCHHKSRGVYVCLVRRAGSLSYLLKRFTVKG